MIARRHRLTSSRPLHHLPLPMQHSTASLLLRSHSTDSRHPPHPTGHSATQQSAHPVSEHQNTVQRHCQTCSSEPCTGRRWHGHEKVDEKAARRWVKARLEVLYTGTLPDADGLNYEEYFAATFRSAADAALEEGGSSGATAKVNGEALGLDALRGELQNAQVATTRIGVEWKSLESDVIGDEVCGAASPV